MISVVIPTLNRPDPLKRALSSVVSQKMPDGVQLEVVVVDNSKDGNARDFIEATIASSESANPNLKLRYISEPNPGVANARNAGVKSAKGEWIAFLDDDEEASPRWIMGHLNALKISGADALFGPVSVSAEDDTDVGVFGSLFLRQYDFIAGADLTPLSAYLGTNNSFFNRERCFNRPIPFSVELNNCGGEDSLLLKQLVMSGRRFAWSADAHVTEWVPARRLNWAYYRKRKYLSGQVRTFVYSMLDSPQWPQIALWMGIGFAQFSICGAASLAVRPFNIERARSLSASALGGLGKVFWMKRFRTGLYGWNLVS